MLSHKGRGAAAALLFGASVAVHAAGLGKLTVHSALGQPLNAEIDLVSVQPGEVDSIQARVATPESFRDASIEYSPSLRLLRFAVDKRQNGQPYLKVTSLSPINEPFVDVLIEMTWPAGRIQREYPILLDPPNYQAKVTPPAAAPKAEAAAPATTTASVTPTDSSGGPSSKTEMPAQGTKAASSSEYGPTEKGDTLNKIATQVKPDSVSLEQMLVALYRENQNAFIGNNMNRLRTGQILKVPAAEDVNKIEVAEARKEYRTQVADWKSYREGVASAAGSLPARGEATRVATGKVASAAIPPPAPVTEPTKDVLKITKSEGKGVAGKAGAGSTQDRLNSMQEELAAKDKALAEANSRVADLEKQIKDMQRLIELKGGAPAKPAETAKAAPTPPPPAVAKVEPTKPAEPAAKPSDTKTAEAPKPAEAPKAAPVDATKTAEAPKTDATKVAEAPKPPTPPAPPKAAPKKAPPPPSLMDEAMDNLPLIAGGVGVLALLGFGGYVVSRRRKERAEAGPTSSMTSAFPSDLKPNTVTGKSSGGLVDTGNSSFLTDFDKTGPGTIDTDEVDPVAEAEVYIAYGRDAQAEEILKEAMAKDKNRHEIALKLLEIYHARKSATAFETVAKELKEAVGESSPLWGKAAAMGVQIDPTNPLYAGASAVAADSTASFKAVTPPAAKPDLDFDIANTPSAAAEAAPAPSFDLDLDMSSKSEAAPAPDIATDASPALDFDINTSTSAAPAVDANLDAAPAKEEKPSFDFDLSGLDFPGASKSAPAAEPEKQPSGASSTMALDLSDLNLDAPAGGGDAGGEAVGTKLELAKAYLEIGDKDGAREILQEVAKEGSSAQKEEAKKLIASL